MEHKAAKRSRSADDDDDEANNNLIQRKVWVSQKMSDARDPEKMREVHALGNLNISSAYRRYLQNFAERTTKMLFDGAASHEHASAGKQEAPALHEHYQLQGDGSILLRDMRPDAVNPRLERRNSRCCQRHTLIHGSCINCTMDLCEECGYSCTECNKFICRSCVTVFDNRPENPLCERCQMFHV